LSNDLLDQEQGSNVKHVNYQLPDCLQPGTYNLTLYEASRFLHQPIFAITQIPVNIENNNPGGSCSGSLQLFPQPQPTSPLSGSPWLLGLDVVFHVLEGAVAVLASVDPFINNERASSPPAIESQSPPGGSGASPAASVPPADPTSTAGSDTNSEPSNDSNPSESQTLPVNGPSSTTGTSPPASTTSSEITTSVTLITTEVSTFSLSGSDRLLTKTVTVTTVLATVTNTYSDGNGILFPASGDSTLRPSLYGPIITIILFMFL